MKKRILSIITAVLVFAMAFSMPIPASAASKTYAVENGNIYIDSTGTVTDCDTSVTEAIIPSEIDGISVKSIGDLAFSGCSSLASVTIPDSVTSIGNSAFGSCSNLNEIVIPSGVANIGSSAFYDCKNLSKVTIPSGVETIGETAFSGCSSLTSVTIPDSITSVGDGSFSNCSSLTEIKVSEANQSYTSIDGVLFNNTRSGLVQYPAGKGGASYPIPSSVTSIGNHAFSGSSSLTSITIPSSVTSIGNYAFYGCSSLTGITLPSGIKNIGNYTFFECSSLTNITLPSGVTSIGNYAFCLCTSLASITIPASVTSIGNFAFRDCKYKLTICGYAGSYAQTYAEENSVSISFQIIEQTIISIENAVISPISDKTYTGSAINLPVTVTLNGQTLTNGTDYTVSYSNNTNAGTAAVTVTGIGSYTGTKTASFTIKAASIKDAVISSISDKTYTGSAISPPVTVTLNGKTLTNGTDYTVSYTNNTNAGTAAVTITGIGNYSGTKTASFTILPPPNPEKEKPKKPIKVKNYPVKQKNGVTIKVDTDKKGKATLSQIKKTNKKKITIAATILIKGVSYKVTIVGAKAFKNCKKVTAITLPNTITIINKNAFYGAKKLKTINLNVKKSITVKKGAFKGLNTKKMTIKVHKKMSSKELKKFKKGLKKAGFKGKVKK